ncbi:Ig-like domain-containing protein [Stigmatella sp. ncwal1]|uniref:Ig-like domain-containing protein n=1 Tax=Stigmatella ashevillensis TaxID=2995309 RepID=A0ABT5DGN4_9BACT|nr:Ig-like domain-containing protein [Stigmatella ashevillena]MDC0712778.1 Ig-like domain-containing protein [Stigmatella ashevillena]
MSSVFPWLSIRWLLFLAGGLLGACGPTPESLTILGPEERQLREPGQSVRLEYEAKDSQGRRLAEPRLHWSSSSPEVATVEKGVVIARKTGQAVIEVSGGRARASTRFVVTIPGRLALRAGEQEFIEIGRPERLFATVLDELGKRMRDASPEWRSQDESIARIEEGRIIGVGPGTVKLSATVGHLSQELTVNVVPAFIRLAVEPSRHVFTKRGQGIQFRARALDSRGRTVEGVPIHWFSSDASVVQVSSAGYVTAVGPGRALVTLSAGRRVGAAEVIVP